MNGHLGLLGIPNLMVTARVDHEDRIEIEAETIEQTYRCCLIQRLGKWGAVPKRRMVNDTQHGGLPAMIHLKVHRAQCYECKKRGIREHFDFIQPGKHMTKRLFGFIARQTVVVGNTNSETGRHLHISEASARRIANTYIDQHVERLNRPTPRVLGIDEKYIKRIFRAVVGNIEQRTVLNMLPDREESLEEYIRNLQDQQNIEVVCIDQYDPYRLMIKKLLPGRAIVTDHFHVVRKANEALDRIRRGLVSTLREDKDTKAVATRLRMSQKLFYCRAHELKPEWRNSIDRWGERFPILHKAYWTKERFYDMYLECSTPAEAEAYYKAWKRSVHPDIEDHFSNLKNIRRSWLPHIFSYFEHPFTTAYVESLNRGLNAMAAEGRRMSFETIRGKLLLAERLEKKTFRDRFPNQYNPSAAFLPPILEHNWGIDIGEMNKALLSVTKQYKLVDGRYIEVPRPQGISTLQPLWDDAA